MPTYPIGQNATTARDGEVNVANVVKGHVNGSNVSDEAIIVPSGAVDLPTTADATNPASGSTRLVARAGGLYVRTSGGAESGPLGATRGEGASQHRGPSAPGARQQPHLPRLARTDGGAATQTYRAAHPTDQRSDPSGARPARHRRHRRLTMPFTRNALIRAIRTAAQAALGAIGAAVLVEQVDWRYLVSSVVMASLSSLLMSVKGLPEDAEPK